MTKAEIIAALEPFDDDQDVLVFVARKGGSPFADLLSLNRYADSPVLFTDSNPFRGIFAKNSVLKDTDRG